MEVAHGDSCVMALLIKRFQPHTPLYPLSNVYVGNLCLHSTIHHPHPDATRSCIGLSMLVPFSTIRCTYLSLIS